MLLSHDPNQNRIVCLKSSLDQLYFSGHIILSVGSLQLLNCDITGIIRNDHCTKNERFYYGFFSRCDQIHRKLRIWSHLLKKYLGEKLIFCAVDITLYISASHKYQAQSEPLTKSTQINEDYH